MSRIERIQKMLTADPDDIELHYMLAMEHRAAGSYDDAVDRFDACIRMKPGYAPAYFQKANTYIAAGHVDQARATLELGIAKARESGDAHAVEEMTELLSSI